MAFQNVRIVGNQDDFTEGVTEGLDENRDKLFECKNQYKDESTADNINSDIDIDDI